MVWWLKHEGNITFTVNEFPQDKGTRTLAGTSHKHSVNGSRIILPLQPMAAGGSSPEGPEVASSTAESLEQQRVWLWQQFASRVTPSVQRVVEFAKRVPGTFCRA